MGGSGRRGEGLQDRQMKRHKRAVKRTERKHRQEVSTGTDAESKDAAMHGTYGAVAHENGNLDPKRIKQTVGEIKNAEEKVNKLQNVSIDVKTEVNWERDDHQKNTIEKVNDDCSKTNTTFVEKHNKTADPKEVPTMNSNDIVEIDISMEEDLRAIEKLSAEIKVETKRDGSHRLKEASQQLTRKLSFGKTRHAEVDNKKSLLTSMKSVLNEDKDEDDLDLTVETLERESIELMEAFDMMQMNVGKLQDRINRLEIVEKVHQQQTNTNVSAHDGDSEFEEFRSDMAAPATLDTRMWTEDWEDDLEDEELMSVLVSVK